VEVVDRARRELARQGVFALATVVEGESDGGMLFVADGAATGGTTGDAELDRAIASRAAGLIEVGTGALVEIEGSRVFIDVLVPPPRLLVVGAGDDAMPLVAYASDVGFRVSVVDHRESLLTSERFPAAFERTCVTHGQPFDSSRIAPTTYAVVMTHSLARDRGWVERLLATDVRYIGVLGPRVRTRDMLDILGADGDARIFGPAGLDVGADGPEQVALSIVAELLACHRRRGAGHLRERGGAIHAPAEQETTKEA
jgi:xanthine dehydrogenase accessory factor